MIRRFVTALVVTLFCVQISLRETDAGPIYDMSAILSQPHPFDTPTVNNPTSSTLTMPSRPFEGKGYVKPVPVKGSPLYGVPLSQPVKDSHDNSGVWRFEMQNEDSFSVDVFEKPMDKFFNEKVESGHLTRLMHQIRIGLKTIGIISFGLPSYGRPGSAIHYSKARIRQTRTLPRRHELLMGWPRFQTVHLQGIYLPMRDLT